MWLSSSPKSITLTLNQREKSKHLNTVGTPHEEAEGCSNLRKEGAGANWQIRYARCSRGWIRRELLHSAPNIVSKGLWLPHYPIRSKSWGQQDNNREDPKSYWGDGPGRKGRAGSAAVLLQFKDWRIIIQDNGFQNVGSWSTVRNALLFPSTYIIIQRYRAETKVSLNSTYI